jgi:hypothetical protein
MTFGKKNYIYQLAFLVTWIFCLQFNFAKTTAQLQSPTTFNAVFEDSLNEVCAERLPKTVIILKTAVGHFERRRNIRQTWAKNYSVALEKVFRQPFSYECKSSKIYENAL